MSQVIVLDQFIGPTPYDLERHPRDFASFLAAVRNHQYDGYLASTRAQIFASRADLPDPLPRTSTVYTCDENGHVTILAMRWTS